MIAIADIRAALARHHPRTASHSDRTPAAVALVLRACQGQTQLLFIERTRQEGDPWSGHIAFPGGRREECDADLRRTAERETREEIGLDLDPAEYLGRLDDLTGASLPVRVAAFVYVVDNPPPLTPNSEVQEAFWVPLAILLDPARQLECQFPFRGLEGRLLPAIDLLEPGRPVLWGITYRFVVQLLGQVGYQLPHPEEKWEENGRMGYGI